MGRIIISGETLFFFVKIFDQGACLTSAGLVLKFTFTPINTLSGYVYVAGIEETSVFYLTKVT